MKFSAIACGSVLLLGAASASAQVYFERTNDPYYNRSANQECWNPRAGHFEQIRPGEHQGDLDTSRCRMIGERYSDRSWDNQRYSDRSWDNQRYADRSSDNRGYNVAREECWNPRARHFEEVRRGERQTDLDYGRCRIYR